MKFSKFTNIAEAKYKRLALDGHRGPHRAM
jgi:hypothetical protein